MSLDPPHQCHLARFALPAHVPYRTSTECQRTPMPDLSAPRTAGASTQAGCLSPQKAELQPPLHAQLSGRAAAPRLLPAQQVAVARAVGRGEQRRAAVARKAAARERPAAHQACTPPRRTCGRVQIATGVVGWSYGYRKQQPSAQRRRQLNASAKLWTVYCTVAACKQEGRHAGVM